MDCIGPEEILFQRSSRVGLSLGVKIISPWRSLPSLQGPPRTMRDPISIAPQVNKTREISSMPGAMYPSSSKGSCSAITSSPTQPFPSLVRKGVGSVSTAGLSLPASGDECWVVSKILVIENDSPSGAMLFVLFQAN